MQIEQGILSEMEKWRVILKRIIDVVLFLSDSGLPFRGSSQRLGCANNGNFLGVVELLSYYDPVLKEHISRVMNFQVVIFLFSIYHLTPKMSLLVPMLK